MYCLAVFSLGLIVLFCQIWMVILALPTSRNGYDSKVWPSPKLFNNSQLFTNRHTYDCAPGPLWASKAMWLDSWVVSRSNTCHFLATALSCRVSSIQSPLPLWHSDQQPSESGSIFPGSGVTLGTKAASNPRWLYSKRETQTLFTEATEISETAGYRTIM